jgi:Ca2+/H+ antiporter, TMEM165/GDT1 family
MPSALFVSTGVIALAEIGDKTQLLAFLLASRSKKPIPIIIGITLATLINHGLAGAVGGWITANINPEKLRWILGASFIAMAAWTLIPDKIENEETQLATKLGVTGWDMAGAALALTGMAVIMLQPRV